MEGAVVPKCPSEDDEPISLRQFLQEQQQKHDDAVEAETAVGGGGEEDSTPAGEKI
jgi:hypothetical protein